MSIKDKPAFPTVLDDGCSWNQGMTLRDYFAAQAMNRFTYLDITNAKSEGYGEFDFGAAAYKAYLYADAMLEARNK